MSPGPGGPGAPGGDAGAGRPNTPGPDDRAAADPPPPPTPTTAEAGQWAAVEEEEVVEAAAEAVELEFDALLGTAQRERDEYLDMLRRVQADFENYKKRMMRQQTDHLERAAEDIVTKLLPTLDAFDLARAHLGDGDDASAEGKALLAASALLADTLGREGLERIDDPGAPFDPAVHEAVDRVPDDAPAPPDAGVDAGASALEGDAPVHDGPVVDGVLRAGYRWKGRVIRPAMVRVRG